MAVTIIPAADNSGATAGWEMLARSIQLNEARKRDRQAQYQQLITQLSDPNTTEEQQNAILTQDPAQFKAFYGVPLDQVGKDVTQFRTAAQSVQSASGMDMNRPEFAGNKRLLVPHPGGTAQQQQQQATLENTRTNTATDIARTKLAEAQGALASKDMQLNVGKATAQIKASMRTADGKVPTFNDVQGYLEGKVELTFLKPEADEREKIAFILGQDENDPVGRTLIHAFENDVKKSDLNLDQTVATIRNVNAEAALKEQEWGLIRQGINPKTGKSMTQADVIEPTKLVALGKSWDEALGRALAPFGMPSRTGTTERRTIPGTNIALGVTLPGPLGTPLTLGMWKSSVEDNPAIAAAIFGNGMADPVSVRRDLLAAAPAGKKLTTVEFPTIDQKTGLATTTTLKVDDLVPRVVQMRRTLSTELPVLFQAMRQASPNTIVYLAATNPMMLQAAKVYAPDVYKLITDARAADAASQSSVVPDATQPASEDPNTAPITHGMQRLQSEVDEINKMMKDAAIAPQ